MSRSQGPACNDGSSRATAAAPWAGNEGLVPTSDTPPGSQGTQRVLCVERAHEPQGATLSAACYERFITREQAFMSNRPEVAGIDGGHVSEPETSRQMVVVRLIEVFVCTALIIYLGTLRVPHFPGDQFLSHDKLLHAIAFGAQALVLYRCLRASLPRWTSATCAWVSIGYATLLGAVLEMLQAMLPYRSMEFGDLAADFFGALVFVWLGRRYNLERPLFRWL
jgi:hypothetical protein